MTEEVNAESFAQQTIESNLKLTPNKLFGCELEYMFEDKATKQPIGFHYEKLESIVDQLVELYGWKKDQPFLLSRGDQHITFEPSGRIELASAPSLCPKTIFAEAKAFEKELFVVGDNHDLTVSRCSLDARSDVFTLPKSEAARYSIMFNRYRNLEGDRGCEMMLLSGATHISLDAASLEEANDLFTFFSRLSPYLYVLSRNLPEELTKDGRVSLWQATDPPHSGFAPALLQSEKDELLYSKWVLDAPIYFIKRDEEVYPVGDKSFRDFMNDGLYIDSLDKTLSYTKQDFLTHATTMFPWIRFGDRVELRVFDMMSPEQLVGVLTFIKPFYQSSDLRRQVEDTLPSFNREELNGVLSVAKDNNFWKSEHPSALNNLLQIASDHVSKDEKSFLKYIENPAEMNNYSSVGDWEENNRLTSQ